MSTYNYKEFDYRNALVNFVVEKKGNLFYLEDINESKIDGMSKRQLYRLINKLFGSGPEEVALMLLDFKENPQATKGYFGVNGYYIFCK